MANLQALRIDFGMIAKHEQTLANLQYILRDKKMMC